MCYFMHIVQYIHPSKYMYLSLCQKSSSPNSTAGEMPTEEDFEYIKLISNGAYGWESTLENVGITRLNYICISERTVL